MSLTYGFFNSVNGDRKYNAEQMSEYFRGIINEGVYQNLDGGLAVTAGTGLAVSVASGRAIVQNRWVQNSEALSLTISSPSEVYARKDAVVIRLNWNTRLITIAVKTGTPAASPEAPELTRTSEIYEMALAYISVSANATSVTVTDKRSDTTVCGWVSVAQATSGEVDAMLNAMKTGFDGVVYSSPAAMVQGCDQKLQDEIKAVGDFSFYGHGFVSSNGVYTASNDFDCYKFVLDKNADLYVKNAFSNNQFVYYIAFSTSNDAFISGYKNTGNKSDYISKADFPSTAYYCWITYATGAMPEYFNKDIYLTLVQMAEKKPHDIIVDPNGNGDYTTIMAALNSISGSSSSNIYNIYVKEGTYDVVSERSNTRYYLPDYVNIIGLGNKEKIIIKGDMDSSVGANVIDQVSVFDANKHNTIKNVTLTAKNCRYVIHSDDYVPESEIIIENCDLIHYGIEVSTTNNAPACFGCGTYDNKTVKCKDSTFTSYNCVAWSTHNRSLNDQNNTKNVFISLQNCVFTNIKNSDPTFSRLAICSEHSILVQSWGSDMCENLEIIGCSCNIDLAHSYHSSNRSLDYDVKGNGNNLPVCYVSSLNNDTYPNGRVNFFQDEQTVNKTTDALTYGDCVKLNEDSSVSKMTAGDSKELFYGVACSSAAADDNVVIKVKGYITTYACRVSEKAIGTKIKMEAGNFYSTTGDSYDCLVKKYRYIDLKDCLYN